MDSRSLLFERERERENEGVERDREDGKRSVGCVSSILDLSLEFALFI